MKEYLQKLIEGQDLTRQEAQAAVFSIGKGKASEVQAAAFLMGIQQKGITIDELIGFRNAMIHLSVQVDLTEFDPIDVCGTGGDGKDTFNISTTAAFVVAGAGQFVAKHGNHGVSSSVGSSTVLHQLGVKFTNDQNDLQNKLEEAGICYMHAPIFHPAMQYIGPVRKELGVKTVFNILGPLLNPANLYHQLIGVSDLATFELYTKFLEKEKLSFGVIHALDGYDEISLTGDFILYDRHKIETWKVADLGFDTCKQEDLNGGNTVEEAAQIVIDILKNKGQKAHTEAVIANAGVALSIAKGVDILIGIDMAWESLKSGKAERTLVKLIK